MSMISMQVDRLRDRAMRVEVFLEGSTDAIPTDTHEQLREAADTIWELSCKLAGMVDQRDEIERLKVENAKLREFTKNAYGHICAQEGYLRGSGYDSFDYFDTVARELGIEE